MSSLTERLLKASKSEHAATIDKSALFQEQTPISIGVPLMNIAFSANPHVGYLPGITTWAGPSRHMKTIFALVQAAAFYRYWKNKGEDPKIVLVDSEFGASLSYINMVMISPADVIHVPVTNIEELKRETVALLNEIKRNEKVFFVFDSIGNLASLKEVQDAEKEDQPKDMTRAAQLKSYFRIVTPMFVIRNISAAYVNHVYQELGMFPKTILGGGQGPMLASNDVFFIGKRKDQSGQGASKTLNGHDFIIQVEKSRRIREGSRFAINVTFDRGIGKYSGIFDLALELGFLHQVKKGSYVPIDLETGEILADDKGHGEKWYIDNPAYYDKLLNDTLFIDKVKSTYALGEVNLLNISVDPE